MSTDTAARNTDPAVRLYWATDYDWRRCEAKLNALPQFKIEIDGLDIHFIHVRSPQQNALPLIVTHGWPGSVIEQLKIIEPLTNPTEHGGTAEDAFDVVIPSLPGYGFSGKPAVTGWDPETAAQRAIGSSSTSGAIIRSAAGPAAATTAPWAADRPLG
jgi:pimeloyl-ACP methyl ester carboxylesterase